MAAGLNGDSGWGFAGVESTRGSASRTIGAVLALTAGACAAGGFSFGAVRLADMRPLAAWYCCKRADSSAMAEPPIIPRTAQVAMADRLARRIIVWPLTEHVERAASGALLPFSVPI